MNYCLFHLVDNNVNKIICLDGVYTKPAPGTNVEGMEEYILGMKTGIERATTSLQPFLELGEVLQKTPVFGIIKWLYSQVDIEAIRQRVLSLHNRIVISEMQLVELHSSICDIVSLYSKTVSSFNVVRECEL